MRETKSIVTILAALCELEDLGELKSGGEKLQMVDLMGVVDR
jgi:hypothetical protein